MVLRRSQAAAELLAGQGGAGEFVHEDVVGVLDGAGLAAMPADEVEARAVRGVGSVGDDAEMAHPVAVAQEVALLGADADGEVAARGRRVLAPIAVARDIIDLGPFADRVGLLAVELPVILRQGGNAFGKLRAHVGRDGIADAPAVEPSHQLVLVERTVTAQVDLLDAAGQSGDGLLDHPSVARAGRDVAVAKLS